MLSCSISVNNCSQKFQSNWGFVSKPTLLVRRIMQIASKLCTECKVAKPLKKAMSSLKLVTFVSIPLNILELKTGLPKLWNSIRIREVEGVDLGAIGALLLVGDSVDSALTTIEGVLDLATSSVPGVIGQISMGLGFAMASIGIGVRSYKIHEMRGIKNQVTALQKSENLEEDLRAYLSKVLGVEGQTQDEIAKSLARQEQKLSLRVGKDMLKELQTLKSYMDLNRSLSEKEQQAALEVLSNVEKVLKRRIGVQAVGIVSNIAAIAALSLFLTPVAPVVPVAFLAFVALVRLALYIYESKFLTHGIDKVAQKVFA